MRPKANIKVVMPNMNILAGEEKKPGLLLRASFFGQCGQDYIQSILRFSQKDVDRNNIEYDVYPCNVKVESA
jgi:hypothetical protein